ncbi:tetrahydromethanopterin S-methyltransferase subunit A [Methanothrix sp.]|mgnify:CR=1 FL=1|uniref:tetrahydromethanopterin S-methyltransferase subunit A n=1 Tax=Methanothrix sp. TaxID=90426 RepID=UPI002C19FBF0|nr:tetrahydromethanopterin S-methyltransferase subunit A [Methanothrix sp.]HOK58189.1 tetrahydromethanopterin S-methyltransferase subunit A [Methanothrix sp.]HOL43513.1 tetrahydromethanopterin S-methyltransferase subunit A [Methanothrix sp.]HPO88612.1 tetrahydromethanopterin S-methyltransferase subunit A [Methanothrix sp.]
MGEDLHDDWPLVRGDYRVVDRKGSVAVVTLASRLDIRGAAIVGTCKTENLGVEKIVANIISNPNIRYLIVCGAESRGHLPGDAILSLHRNGIDESGRIIGAAGAIPFIQNLQRDAVERFRRQIDVVDMRGVEDTAEIERIVDQYSGIAEPFPEPPFEVVKKTHRARAQPCDIDVSLGQDVYLDVDAWAVFPLTQKAVGA